MAKYITKENLLIFLNECRDKWILTNDYADIYNTVSAEINIQFEDAEPKIQAMWKLVDEKTNKCICTNCNCETTVDFDAFTHEPLYTFCPRCNAKMEMDWSSVL